MDDARQTALIAADDELFRIAIRSILIGRLGLAEVIEAESLEQALARLEEHQGTIKAAFFDLATPGLESPAGLATVRELFPHLSVIAVSATQRRQDVLAALGAGVHGFLSKDMKADDVATALKLIFDGTVYVPSWLAEMPFTGGSAAVATEKARWPSEPKQLALTPRQRQVLELLAAGKSNKEIAQALSIAEGTVKVHLAALFRTLGVTNRAAAAAAGVRLRPGGAPGD